MHSITIICARTIGIKAAIYATITESLGEACTCVGYTLSLIHI